MDAVTPPFVDAAHIRRLVDDGAYQRGEAYFADGAVLQVTWDPASSVIESVVAGSGDRNYRCRIRLDPHRPERVIAATSCTCPMQFDCKHAVATLLAGNRLAERAPARAESWRSVLAPADDGNLTLSPDPVPPPAVLGESSTVTATWSGLDVAKRYFGAVNYAGSDVITFVSIG